MTVKFSCSSEAQVNICHALSCLPKGTIAEIDLLFVCIDSSDARRLVMSNYIDYEIIVISEFIVPRNWKVEDHWSKRYFNYVILHEIAHALLKHKSPTVLTQEESKMQEDEADSMAMEWFNEYAEYKEMILYTQKELEDSQNKIQLERKKYLIL